MSQGHVIDTSELGAALMAALGECVHLPGALGYQLSLDRVFFPDASRRRPPVVVHPRSAADVAAAMRVVHNVGGRVTVRGGGLSSNCVADDAVMIDMSVHLSHANPVGDQVRVDGGATVGDALAAMEPAGRVIPVGIVGLAGFGLVTRGGVGYLTRSVGLTLDHLVEVEIVLPTGELVRLSDDSSGREADLWWAVRGSAPAFGVVTSAILRTQPQGPMFVDRLVVGLDALATYFAVAPDLPRSVSMGGVLGYFGDVPALFVYTTCRSPDSNDAVVARNATTAVAAASSAGALYRSEMTGRYVRGLPQFAFPGPNGEEPQPIRLPEPDDERGWFYGKSVFTGPTFGPELAAGLADAIRAAPTPACRIDFQHTGGALADVADGATAFWGRGAEWNVPLNAIWDSEADGDACYEWARDTLSVLRPATVGVYSVEVRPGFAETDDEIRSAYGGNLSRLRALRAAVDPTGVLGAYPL